jgi:hypothetical protein
MTAGLSKKNPVLPVIPKPLYLSITPRRQMALPEGLERNIMLFMIFD